MYVYCALLVSIFKLYFIIVCQIYITPLRFNNL